MTHFHLNIVFGDGGNFRLVVCNKIERYSCFVRKIAQSNPMCSELDECWMFDEALPCPAFGFRTF